MEVILVTGPIGSGKSAVCSMLHSMGYPVYDCDSRCKNLYETVPGLRDRIEKELDLPFSELGKIFSDGDKREKLETIVYPLLLEDMRKWIDSQDSAISFIESAVALEKPIFDGLYDRVLFVDAPLEVRKKRNPKAEERDSLQCFDKARMDFTIWNDTDLEGLETQVDLFLDNYR